MGIGKKRNQFFVPYEVQLKPIVYLKARQSGEGNERSVNRAEETHSGFVSSQKGRQHV